jgi:hypothetical protein
MIRRSLLLLLPFALCACPTPQAVTPRSNVAAGANLANNLSARLAPGTAAPAATATPADDHANERAEATVIRSGDCLNGALETTTDVDWFVVDLNAGPHTFSLSSFGDARVVLLDTDANRVLGSSDVCSCEFSVTPPAAGRYFLRVEPGSGAGVFYGLQVD